MRHRVIRSGPTLAAAPTGAIEVRQGGGSVEMTTDDDARRVRRFGRLMDRSSHEEPVAPRARDDGRGGVETAAAAMADAADAAAAAAATTTLSIVARFDHADGLRRAPTYDCAACCDDPLDFEVGL